MFLSLPPASSCRLRLTPAVPTCHHAIQKHQCQKSRMSQVLVRLQVRHNVNDLPPDVNFVSWATLAKASGETRIDKLHAYVNHDLKGKLQALYVLQPNGLWTLIRPPDAKVLGDVVDINKGIVYVFAIVPEPGPRQRQHLPP
eukprot:jgi/Chlat1/919/Chrsp108S08615